MSYVHQLSSSWYRRGAGIPHGRVILRGFLIGMDHEWRCKVPIYGDYEDYADERQDHGFYMDFKIARIKYRVQIFSD
jgi:hypothetical protein